MLTMMILSVVCSIAFTACGRKQPANVITTRESQPRQVATDTPIETFVKDSTGKKVLTHDVAKAGEYIIGDTGGKQPKAPVVDPAPQAAPVTLKKY